MCGARVADEVCCHESLIVCKVVLGAAVPYEGSKPDRCGVCGLKWRRRRMSRTGLYRAVRGLWWPVGERMEVRRLTYVLNMKPEVQTVRCEREPRVEWDAQLRRCCGGRRARGYPTDATGGLMEECRGGAVG